MRATITPLWQMSPLGIEPRPFSVLNNCKRDVIPLDYRDKNKRVRRLELLIFRWLFQKWFNSRMLLNQLSYTLEYKYNTINTNSILYLTFFLIKKGFFFTPRELNLKWNNGPRGRDCTSTFIFIEWRANYYTTPGLIFHENWISKWNTSNLTY